MFEMDALAGGIVAEIPDLIKLALEWCEFEPLLCESEPITVYQPADHAHHSFRFSFQPSLIVQSLFAFALLLFLASRDAKVWRIIRETLPRVKAAIWGPLAVFLDAGKPNSKLPYDKKVKVDKPEAPKRASRPRTKPKATAVEKPMVFAWNEGDSEQTTPSTHPRDREFRPDSGSSGMKADPPSKVSVTTITTIKTDTDITT